MPDYGYLLPTRGVVQSSGDSETLAAKAESDVVGLARRAEARGFASVWAGDSVLAKPRLEPLSTMAAVATATNAVELGTAVYLPPLRHPVHVAHLAATVDQLSGGRFNFGVGVGIGPDVEAEYDNLGVSFEERGRRLTEQLEILTRIWSGESVNYDGQFYTLREASLEFQPVRSPPIYIPSAAFDPTEGFPSPIRERLVEYGDGWVPIAISPDAYADSLDTVRELLNEAGRDPATFDPALYVDVVVDDESTALETARQFYDRYYPEWDTLSDEQIRERGAFGPPAQVAETLDAFADAGAETVIVRFTAADQRAQLREFVDAVDIR